MRAFAKYAPILALLGAMTVHADTDPTTPAGAGPVAPASPGMSVADMRSGATKIDAQMNADLNEVLQFKEIARKKKDVIKLNCVNDRLIQIKAQINIGDSTNQQLQVALVKGATDAQALFSQLSGIGEQVKRLRAEADSCIGAPDLMKQESGNEVQHPFIPDDPTVLDPFEPEMEPPGYASPFN